MVRISKLSIRSTISGARVSAALAIALLATGCGSGNPDRSGDQARTAGVAPIDPRITPIAEAALGSYSFAASTPTGRKVFRYAVGWNAQQMQGANRGYFPQAAMCATNLTEVFEEVFGRRYRHEAVGSFLDQLRAAGSYEVSFRGDSEASIVRKLNALHAPLSAHARIKTEGRGLLPVGTVLGGCEVGTACLGDASSAHIAMIGHASVKPGPRAGTKTILYWAWHNNWLRKLSADQRARDLGSGLGKLDAYSLPTNWPTLGYERRWMSTPWLEVVYTDAGEALSARRVIPELDDLDPGNAGFDTWLVVPAEVRAELEANTGFRTGGGFGGGSDIPARAGTAAMKGITWMKRNPMQAADLPASDRCQISNPATVITYSHRSERVNDHVKVRLAFPDAACPAFGGDVWLFADHWAFRDR